MIGKDCFGHRAAVLYSKLCMAPYEIKGHSSECALASWKILIRDLCAKVTAAPQSELQTAITNLQAALREHALRIENKAIKDLLKGMGKPDRRKR